MTRGTKISSKIISILLIPIFLALPAYANAPQKIDKTKILANLNKIVENTPEKKPEFKAPDPKVVELPKPVDKVVDKPVVSKPNVLVIPRSSEEEAFNQLVARESGGNPLAVNTSSLACGLGQFLPCKKLLDYANYMCPVQTTVIGLKQCLAQIPYETQAEFMRIYITNRYGNANNALAFWNRNGWY